MPITRRSPTTSSTSWPRAPAIPTLNFLTHNDNDHTDPDDRVCANLITSLTAITECCRARGITPVGATLDQICDMVLAAPAEPAPFVYT